MLVKLLAFPFVAVFVVISLFLYAAIYSIKPILLFAVLSLFGCFLFGNDILLSMLYAVRAGLILGIIIGLFSVIAVIVNPKHYKFS